MVFIPVLAVLLVASGGSALPAFNKTDFTPLIVGGTQARRGEFPSIVQIRRGNGHYCGGVIVNTNWIVTAAHCSLGTVGGYTIVAGEHDISQANEGSEQYRIVSRIIVHPNYNENSQANDIALMRVGTPFVLGAYVATASLASSDPTGNVVAAGWGKLSEGGSNPTILMKVTVPMVTLTICRQSYSILAGMICAGIAGKDSCQGDSGGPLYNGNELSGIVSFGIGCARPNYPGVYSSVTYFRSWITSNAN